MGLFSKIGKGFAAIKNACFPKADTGISHPSSVDDRSQQFGPSPSNSSPYSLSYNNVRYDVLSYNFGIPAPIPSMRTEYVIILLIV